jgi:hypothetical protein
MRVIPIFILLICSIAAKAQTYAPFRSIYSVRPGMFGPSQNSFENPGNKKWFVSKYASVSAGYSFFRGGGVSYLSAPIGLQLNRKLSNNLYAFAGASVNPTYFNFNQPIPLSGANKSFYSNNMFGPNNFGIYPRAELGLMYMNDDKTFSISGSISVQRSSYPMFPAQPVNTTKPAHITRSNN